MVPPSGGFFDFDQISSQSRVLKLRVISGEGRSGREGAGREAEEGRGREGEERKGGNEGEGGAARGREDAVDENAHWSEEIFGGGEDEEAEQGNHVPTN